MSTTGWEHAFLSDTSKPIWRLKLRKGWGQRKKGNYFFPFLLQNKYFLMENKTPVSKKWRVFTMDRVSYTSLFNEKWKVDVINVSSYLQPYTAGNEQGSIFHFKAPDFSISLSYLAHLQPVCKSKRLVQSFSIQWWNNIFLETRTMSSISVRKSSMYNNRKCHYMSLMRNFLVLLTLQPGHNKQVAEVGLTNKL